MSMLPPFGVSLLQKYQVLTQRRKAATIFDLLQKISNQFHESTAKSPGFNAKAQSRQDD
jgi:hypothetical protein